MKRGCFKIGLFVFLLDLSAKAENNFQKFVSIPNKANYESVLKDIAFDTALPLPNSKYNEVVEKLLDKGGKPRHPEDSTLDALLLLIKKGDPLAIELGIRLSPFLNASYAEDRDIYIGKWIKPNPRLFLKALLNVERALPKQYLSIESLVGNFGDEFVDDFEKQSLEANARIAALKKVRDKSLLKVRDVCIQELTRIASEKH